MSEVYEVCQRLKAAGFPQESGMGVVCYNPDVSPLDYTDGQPYWYESPFDLGLHKGVNGGVFRFLKGTSIIACPNASECMKEAKARGWFMKVQNNGYAGVEHLGMLLIIGESYHADPDQAARLALAAALEADNAK